MIDDASPGTAGDSETGTKSAVAEHDMTPLLLLRQNAEHILGQMLVGDRTGTETTGDHIGPYRLCERVGAGGFGNVWRAEQTTPVSREVALKIIKRGIDTVQVLARFDHERQALASMKHPSIASMIDAGMAPDGRPYFAMELVKGPSITHWCEAARADTETRLRLFQQVCMAVQHAHQKGVIHRDLKPSNILIAEVNGSPLPKIIDFGIAKAVHRDAHDALTFLTQASQTVGTPVYMSPEQITGAGTLDTRSDVYTLGVILYQLLTGTLPLDAGAAGADGLADFKRTIARTQPERPSTRVRRKAKQNHLTDSRAASPATASPIAVHHLVADLDWITMRALEKDPARRYQSASDFADDIARFLEGTPVLARSPSFGYIAGRWIMRHRVSFSAACAVLLALVAATVVSLRQAANARAAQIRAEAETRRAVENERRAHEQEKRAQQSGAFVTDLLDRVAREIGRGRNPEALKLALDGSEKRILALDGDPALRIELLGRLAEMNDKVGEPRAMLPLLKARADEIARLHGPASEEALSAELTHLKGMMDHGNRGLVPELVKALRTRTEAAGMRGTRLWFEVQRALVRSWMKLKDAPRAVEEADKALAEAQRLKLKRASRFLIEMTAVSALELAGEYDRAEKLLDEIRAAAARFDDTRRVEEAEKALQHILGTKKDFARAAELQRDRLPRIAGKFGAESSEMVASLCELIASECDARELEEALSHATTAVAIARKRPDDRCDLFKALMALAAVQEERKFRADAIAFCEEALAVARDADNKAHMIRALDHLGRYRYRGKDYLEAHDAFKEHLDLTLAAHASTKDVVESMKSLSEAQSKLGLHPEAMETARQMWDRLTTDEALLKDKGFAAEIAGCAAKCARVLQDQNPAAPRPSKLAEWLMAAEAAR